MDSDCEAPGDRVKLVGLTLRSTALVIFVVTVQLTPLFSVLETTRVQEQEPTQS